MMTISLPLEYREEVRIQRIDDYDEYRMIWDYFQTQFLRKKAGKPLRGWQITSGKIPLKGTQLRKVRFIT